MLASNAAERLQAEGTLRAQKGSLVGEVAMLSQAKEGLALRVAQLKSSLGVADSLAESRLKECQAAVLQACTSSTFDVLLMLNAHCLLKRLIDCRI